MRASSTTVVRRVCAAALVLAAVAAACSSPAKPPVQPLLVGALYPLSGGQGPGGGQEFHGVQLAAEFANSAGGVRGRPIVLRAIDVPGSDAVPDAIEAFRRAHIRLLLGSYGSTISRPASALAYQNRMLFWETGAVGLMSSVGAGRLVFRVAPTGAQLGRTAIDFIANRLAPFEKRPVRSLRFAVAAVRDLYGLEVANGAIAEIHKLGLGYAGEVEYSPYRLNPPGIVHALARLKPNVLFAASYVHDGVAIRRETVREHLPLLTAIGTSSSYCMPAFGAALGKDAVGLFASDKPDAEYLNPQGLLPPARALLDRAESRYRAQFGGEMEAPALAGFAAAWALFHDVMPRARDLTPEGVAAAARTARLPTGSLPNGSGLQFGPPGAKDAGANLRATSVIWEWTGIDHRVVVWPPRFAMASVQKLPIVE